MNRISKTINEKVRETIDESIKAQLDKLQENGDFVIRVEKVFTENHPITKYPKSQINKMVTTTVETYLEERVKEQIKRTARAQFKALNKRRTDHREICENRLDKIEREDVNNQEGIKGITKKETQSDNTMEATDDQIAALKT